MLQQDTTVPNLQINSQCDEPNEAKHTCRRILIRSNGATAERELHTKQHKGSVMRNLRLSAETIKTQLCILEKIHAIWYVETSTSSTQKVTVKLHAVLVLETQVQKHLQDISLLQSTKTKDINARDPSLVKQMLRSNA